MKYFLITLLSVSSQLIAQKNSTISLDNPPKELTLFGEGFISTAINERDFAISPDGNEIFYTISTPKSTFQTIVSCKKTKSGWTSPEVVSFCGVFSDLEPALSADGKTMYFSSNRPLTGTSPKDFDIWKVARIGDGWGKPENLGEPVNTDADEFYPSIAKSGNLYFTAAYSGGVGKEDIYLSELTNNAYQKPMPLDTAVNSRLYEFNAFVSSDEKYILFTSYGRKDDIGSGDLYISQKDPKGKWTSARNLKELNSLQLDYCPYLSPDGKSLFITSERHQLPRSFSGAKASYKTITEVHRNPLNGTGNIFWINFTTLREKLK